MAYVPDQGDIVWLDFNLSSGKEIMKRRPAFVISRKALNNHTGLTIVAPITSTIRNTSMEVVMSNGQKTEGAVLVYQLKSLDFKQWQVEFIERASAETIRQVTTLAKVIIQ
jgi:mRNA-degrading endonuclease toxin of MazEF toxin-antitoxin module|tara:strand:- start:443 stop:775 length:333 start_codon:yes stop_codon:yes gene_type:complete